MLDLRIKPYIYLKIPMQWKYIYDNLRIKMAELGDNLLKECNASCNGDNKEYIACWNMFQAACASYDVNRKRSKLLIQYIIAKLNIKEVENIGIVYTGAISNYYNKDIATNTTTRIDIFNYEKFEEIINNSSLRSEILKFYPHPIVSNLDTEFIIHQNGIIHYILVPPTIEFVEAYYGNGCLKTILKDKNHCLYRVKDIQIDDRIFKLYYYYSPIGEFTDNIHLKFKI